MKVSYEEGLANHFGLRRRCDCGNNVALNVRAGGSVGQLMSSEIRVSGCRPCHGVGKTTSVTPLMARREPDPAESLNLCMRGKFQTREPGDPIGSSGRFRRSRGRSANLSEGTADMNAGGKSDDLVVPTKRANKAATAVAEPVEERRSPKGSDGGLVCISDTEPKLVYFSKSPPTTGNDARHRDRPT
jgi:hypothetical protein